MVPKTCGPIRSSTVSLRQFALSSTYVWSFVADTRCCRSPRLLYVGGTRIHGRPWFGAARMGHRTLHFTRIFGGSKILACRLFGCDFPLPVQSQRAAACPRRNRSLCKFPSLGAAVVRRR